MTLRHTRSSRILDLIVQSLHSLGHAFSDFLSHDHSDAFGLRTSSLNQGATLIKYLSLSEEHHVLERSFISQCISEEGFFLFLKLYFPRFASTYETYVFCRLLLWILRTIKLKFVFDIINKRSLFPAIGAWSKKQRLSLISEMYTFDVSFTPLQI